MKKINADDIESVVPELYMDGWNNANPDEEYAGTFIDADGNKHTININDPDAMKLANESATDSIFQFDTSLAKCVSIDTFITTEDDEVPIPELSIFDKIAYLSEDGIKYTNNYELVNSGHKTVKEVELEDGRILEMTDDHRVLTPEGYKPVYELKEGDKVIVLD